MSRIIDRAVRAQDDGIVKFALRQIDRAHGWDRRWDILEAFLAHVSIQFPHSFDYVARVIAWRARRDDPLDKALWRDVVVTVAGGAATLGHDSELVWALWLMKELGIKVSKRQLDLYTRTSGPLVLSLLAHMTTRGLTTQPALLNSLQDRVVGDDQFSGALWPLSLELYHLGHHNRLDAHRAPGSDLLDAWHVAGKSLINWDGLPRVFERDDDEPEQGDWEPEFAIEDFASAYDDDDDEEQDDGWGTGGAAADPFEAAPF